VHEWLPGFVDAVRAVRTIRPLDGRLSALHLGSASATQSPEMICSVDLAHLRF
jgi:hypothetical protein